MTAIGLMLMWALCSAQPSSNLLANAGFENGLEGWTFGCLRSVPGDPYAASSHASAALDTQVFAEGKQSVRLTSTLAYDDTDPRAVVQHKPPNVGPGHYRFSVRYRVKAEDGEGFGCIISDWNGGRFDLRLRPHEEPWRRVERLFHIPRRDSSWRILLYIKGKGAVWYDDVRLVKITQEEFMKAHELPPRSYRIETALVDGKAPAAVIVSSRRRPAYAQVARRVQSCVKRLTAVELPVLDAGDTTTTDTLSKTNAIVLGNLVTNPFVETLYWEWYTLLDLWYPGPGGYVLRTLHDPYGTGRNVIFLGGSDDRGVREACDAFCRVLEAGSTPKVGRLMEIRLGAGHEMPPKGEWMDPRLRLFNTSLPVPPGYTSVSRAGLVYHYNGDENAAKVFRDRALKTSALSNADHYSAHMYALVWDLIEESPIFSDEDRKRITAKLLVHARGKDGTAGIDRLLHYPESQHLLDRHASMQAICTLTASRYFGKHWPSEEWTANLAAVRKYFDRQMTTGKGDSDLGGRGIYSYFECALIPALLLRDRRFIDSGAMRLYGELCLMHCDNTGYMPDSGQSGHTSYPTYTLHKCAALLNDGSFLATMPRREEAERIGRYSAATSEFSAGQAWATGIEPRPMDKMVGVYHLPLTTWEHEVRGGTTPIGKCFDKLTMRTGFGRDDQYLLLDGLHGGPPGKPWPDVNSIVNFGQNGRIFLVSAIGGENPVNHNVVTVSKDGLGAPAHRVASLEATANLPTFGYSHSRVQDYGFTSWDRHIFWRKRGWFVVLDRLVARQEGRYEFECQWRTIGEPHIDGSDYSAAVCEGPKAKAVRDVLHIKSGERYPLRYSEQLRGLFGPPETKRWQHYCRRKCINRVRQVAGGQMKPGDEQVFTSLFYVGGDRTHAAYEIAKLGEHAAVLTGDELAYVGLADAGPFERAGLGIHGQAFCASATSVAVVNARRIEAWGTVITVPSPCNVEVDPASGRCTVESRQAVVVSVDGQTHQCRAGSDSIQLAPRPADALAAFADQIRLDAARSAATRASAAQPKGIPTMAAAWTFDAGAPVLRIHAGDVDRDHEIETLLGLGDSRVLCLNAQGKPRWEFRAKGAVRAITHADIDAGPAVIAGSDDQHVYALRPDSGQVIWQHKCRVAHRVSWWTTGMRAKVQTILADDLDGDGQVELICATGGGCVETLSNAGERKWLTPIHWGIPDRLATVAMPGGHKTLLVSNSYSSSQSTTWRLAADGRLLSGNALDNGRGGWDMTAAPGLKVVDLDGDGRLEAIVGRKGAFNEVALHDAATGERKWLHTLADSVSAVEALDVNSDGVKEIIVGSPSTWLCAFSVQGEMLWAEQMPHEIVAIAARPDGLFVACADQAAYRVNLEGRAVARYSLEGMPSWHFAGADGILVAADSLGHTVALLAR